jgi:Flp pilus assembly protein TadG
MNQRRSNRSRGQGLVEFSLALVPFVIVVMGIVDLGRGIYENNGVSEAAREIARVTAVHPGTTVLGDGTETLGVINTQKGLVPGLADPGVTITISCEDVAGNTVSPSSAGLCASTWNGTNGYIAFVKVRIDNVPFAVVTPVLGMVSPKTFGATAHVQAP